MTLTRRVIACLDVRDGRAVKGVAFRDLRDAGDPVLLAERYAREGADEIVFLDVAASIHRRGTLLDVARQTAERLFVPLTIGGGIRRVDDADAALRAGADKIAVNSAAVARPALLGELAERFGRQAVVASVDAKRTNGSWEVMTHGGTRATGLDAIEWAARCAEVGAGEVLLTSIDRDGGRVGYDLELTGQVSARVQVPVIASGGAGNAGHVADVLERAVADAALVAGILHDGSCTVRGIKSELKARGVPVREA